MQRQDLDVWSLIQDELIPKTFKVKVELESVCAALARTGLVVPMSAWGGLVYRFSWTIKQLGELAELDDGR